MKWPGKLVIVNGWSMPASLWCDFAASVEADRGSCIIDLDQSLTCQQWCQRIAAEVDDSSLLLGWSLGGTLAIAAVAGQFCRPAALLVLQTNPCFVARSDWPTAMAPAIYEGFEQGLRENLAATLKKFDYLAAQVQADPGQLPSASSESAMRATRDDLKALKAARADGRTSPEALANGLHLLRELDVRTALAGLRVPTLLLLGEADALVPVSLAEMAVVDGVHARVRVIPGMGHCPWGSFAPQVRDALAGWLQGLPQTACPGQSLPLIDKALIAGSFSRAAASYDQAAHLQREIADHLFDLAASLSAGVGDSEPAGAALAVDLGSGTGYSLPALQALPRVAQVVAVDLAEGMLRHSRERHPLPGVFHLVGDAENLPLKTGSADLVFSSLAIQWCSDNTRLFAEIRRVLKPGGWCALATLLDGTLHELRQAWERVDQYQHVNEFCRTTDLVRAMQQAGLQVALQLEQQKVLYYDAVTDLTRELKMLGAHNVTQNRPRQSTSRARLSAFLAAYESFRSDSGLPATYEIAYFVLKAPPV